MRRTLAVVAALLIGTLTLYGVGVFSPAPASAFQPPKVRPPTANELRAYKDLLRITKDGSTEASKTKARQIVTRNVLKAAPRVGAWAPAAVAAGGGAVAVGGLAAAAVGVWSIVGLELWYMPCWGCGSEMVATGIEMRQAQGSMAMTYTSNSKSTAMVTYIGGRRLPETNQTSLTYYGTRSIQSWDHWKYNGTENWAAVTPAPASEGVVGKIDSFSPNIHVSGPAPVPMPKLKPTWGSFSDRGGTALVEVSVNISGDSQTKRIVCPGGEPCLDTKLPTFDLGSAGLDATDKPKFTTTPDEGNAVITSIVADPETMPLVETEPATDPYPEDFPADPFVDPYENPDGDPDGDGIPNKDDDDPEGDGDPDGDGDPNEHPYLAPPPELPDTDHDGIPDTDDPDDDGDGIPDEQDPNPLVWEPPPDADADGIPDSTDPDDDNDGIPDESDPDPLTPTDPATLPVDHPYADPDGDGVPNKDDDDDDADGTPDEADTEPTNPDQGGDLDRDGIPDQSDGDQDGDGVPDWEDTGTREKSIPVAPGAPAPDEDGDGVPDWSDPWPGNPYAPADPTIDGDGDGVPDFKDPVITDPVAPMKPWPTGSPGEKPGNPGQPNIPASPTNTNYPTSPTMPANPANPSSWPTDPTSPTSTSTQINPSEPMPPGEAGGPPPPAETATSCPTPRPWTFVLPKLNIANVFPFSLVLWAWEAMAQLTAAPEAPTFNLGFLGVVSLAGGTFGGVVAVARTLIWLIAGVCMAFMFYGMIRSGSS